MDRIWPVFSLKTKENRLTPEQHNKYLGISHLAYGGLFCLFMLLMLVFFLAMIPIMRAGPDGPPAAFFGIIWLFFAVFYGAMTVPSLIAGYGLLKKKSWAKTAAIIAGVFSAMSFPIGTAVCVYTFWFLFSEPGKAVYDRLPCALPPGRQTWHAESSHQQKEAQYVPPQSPPDWR